MSKTFTCRELGGVCDERFSGDTFTEIMQKGAQHMMSDDAHKASIMDMEKRTGENQGQWMERTQREFGAKPEDSSLS
jgi:predicted small metal-binding protein